MVERFNGRIEEVLQSHHFRSGEELETIAPLCLALQPPASTIRPTQKNTLANNETLVQN
jgi:hypothetical protein